MSDDLEVPERLTRWRLILGSGWGETAPVPLHSETIYADATLAPQAALPLPGAAEAAPSEFDVSPPERMD